MRTLQNLANALLLVALPVVGFAHPGHFDGAPLAHEATHAMPYVLMLVAGCILVARRIRHLRRAKNATKANDARKWPTTSRR